MGPNERIALYCIPLYITLYRYYYFYLDHCRMLQGSWLERPKLTKWACQGVFHEFPVLAWVWVTCHSPAPKICSSQLSSGPGLLCLGSHWLATKNSIFGSAQCSLTCFNHAFCSITGFHIMIYQDLDLNSPTRSFRKKCSCITFILLSNLDQHPRLK
jgi:hypothetical protein